MRYKPKRLVLAMLTAVMLLQSVAPAAATENEGGAAEAGASDEASAEESTGTPNENYITRTEQEVLDGLEVVAENDNLILYFGFDQRYEMDDGEIEESGKETELFALYNKKNGYIWWSTPINSEADRYSTPTQRKELQSGLIAVVGDPNARSTQTFRSGQKGSVKSKSIKNGVQLTYSFSAVDIKVPVSYTLEEDYLKVSVQTEDITEGSITGEEAHILASLEFSPAFGAGSADEEGYFVIPDGSGAVIEFNNGKVSSKEYIQPVYSSELSAVPTTAPSVTKNVTLPVYGIVKEDNALMVVASKGDSNASINCQMSRATKSTSYNVANFNFTLRGTDTYYLSGINPLTVFETGEIKTPELELRYYPISDSEGEVDYVDVASGFRDYLINDCGVVDTTTASTSSLCLDLYGGTMSNISVLGFPVEAKTSVTSFSNAVDILTALDEKGVDDIVLAYNDWTNAAISNEIDYKAKPASTLGGSSAFKKLMSYINDKAIDLYPVVNNVTFNSGNGYFTLFDTTVRVSGEYSRVFSYNRAYGIRNKAEGSTALLSPAVYTELYEKLAENYADYGLKGASLGEMSYTLYGDYSKKAVSRQMAMESLAESARLIQEKTGSLLGDNSNCYLLPYTNYVQNVPLTSSGFDLFDYDIPFKQLVLHGLIPYSTIAINGDADAEKAFLMAIATGSDIHYDMLYEETTLLKDTDYDEYFYANYQYWLDTAAAEYKLAKEILSQVSDATITAYDEVDGVVTTVYSNGITTSVDTNTGVIKCGDKEYRLVDYIAEGDLVF